MAAGQSEFNPDQSQEAEAEVCLGCRFSKRSVLQSVGLALREGIRYKKPGCPGKFLGLVKQFSVVELPQTGIVEACPDAENWSEIVARYPGYPRRSVVVNGHDPFTIGLDSVKLQFQEHVYGSRNAEPIIEMDK